MKSDQDDEEKAERRIEIERRQFSYFAHIPERRSGQKRRKEDGTNKTPDDPSTPDSDN